MVSTGTAGNNLIETRPTIFLLMGQIPGTTHISCNDLVSFWGNEIKSPDQVKALLEAKGVDLSQPVYITCGWGITVCVLEAAMQGIEGV